MSILIFLSKFGGKWCTLYMAKYGNVALVSKYSMQVSGHALTNTLKNGKKVLDINLISYHLINYIPSFI